ncbi:MAG: hypothetical protein QS2022_2090 [Candidatus Phytoplasma asteris]|uniref:Uncharacterized protein n=1 Tax='Chrysanthemum coronarium' phytoplasma TaxID=1520703 RepID=A0ABQ0J319_9MOLU|nr:hypothetical protein ['Chrysanthemum coronarium' phytoplasma]TKA87987.1 MAG: putative secreted protein [Periwinkle leaf yellowing phytoplasma]WEX19485.1 MAG: hypothetical protein QS2022_2090 [Candidatus Phytoplasma asteris]GAK73954.1 uncharacterized protein OYV_04390 ['Chrysanthemum coronarium' phytoplasma]
MNILKKFNTKKTLLIVIMFCSIWFIFLLLSIAPVFLSDVVFKSSGTKISHNTIDEYIDEEIQNLKSYKMAQEALNKLKAKKQINFSEKENLLQIIENSDISEEDKKNLQTALDSNIIFSVNPQSNALSKANLIILEKITDKNTKKIKNINFIKKENDFIHSEPIYKIEIIKQNDTYYLITDDRFFNKKKDFLEENKIKIPFEYYKKN